MTIRNIRLWREQFFGLLTDLADLERTREEWLSSTHPRGFAEDVCIYFNDLDLDADFRNSDGLQRAVADGRLNEAEAGDVRLFHEAFDRYVKAMPLDDERSDSKILGDPKWAQVAQLAAESCQKIQASLAPR